MSPAYTYTYTSTKQPSFARSLIIRLENALVFMGFIVGIMLIFENIGKILNGNATSALEMLFMSFILWFGGYFSRYYFSKRWGDSNFEIKERVRVEVLYFLFCYTFTTMFITTLLRYMPRYFYDSNLQDFTFLTEYFNGAFVIKLVLNFSIIVVFLLGILSFCEFLFNSFFKKVKYTQVSEAKYRTSKIFLLAFMLLGTLVVIQIPFVSSSLDYLHGITLNMFTTNLRWVFDYLLVFPIFYYLYASFVGSLPAEKFSVERKLL